MPKLSTIQSNESTLVPLNIAQSVEVVTPAIAKEWLSTMVKAQRNPAPSKVLQYSRAMLLGHWTLSAGILFNTQDQLIDGQHRLLAVIKSGVSNSFIINRNMPDDSIYSIDIGVNRSTTHMARLAGIEATTTHTGVVNCCFYSPQSMGSPPVLSKFEQLEVMKKHWDAIAFSLKTFGTASAKYAPFLAPVARAYYTENRERLEEFLKVYHTGFAVSQNAEDDSAAIALRNLYFSEQKRRGSSVSTSRIQDSRRASGALKNFIAKRPIKCIKETTVNHFPVADFDSWWSNSLNVA